MQSSVREVRCVFLIAFVLAFDTDGGSKLQRAAAVQKEEKRGLQWGDRGGREAWENPQMYCGESAVCSAIIEQSLYALCTWKTSVPCIMTCTISCFNHNGSALDLHIVTGRNITQLQCQNLT